MVKRTAMIISRKKWVGGLKKIRNEIAILDIMLKSGNEIDVAKYVLERANMPIVSF